jgi:hypothetical protein
MIDLALARLRPGSVWSVTGDTYEGIDWQDQTQTKPTKAAVEAEVVIIKAEFEAKRYQRLREREYPDFRQYLDGIVKGDETQMQAYIDACNAVKLKYPKPE